MPLDYTLSDLVYWSEKIEKTAASFSLDFYPQEFELVNYRTMLEAQTYVGMFSFYPHESFGKNYEYLATLYRFGLTYLPYELVINSNPCIGRLMDGNDLAMQILTMAHCYGHNNFFKNNCHFRRLTKAGSVIDFFRTSAETIRQYSADPSIGPRAVARCITAAHAIRYQSRDVSVQYLPDTGNDLLLFLMNNTPRKLENWERDIIMIVVEVFNYLRPQMMTPIMNEGWASYWHYQILKSLGLSPYLRSMTEKHHNNVVRFPDDPTQINPYFIGFEIWKDINQKHSNEIFSIMVENHDASFVEKYLDQELMIRLGLFGREIKGGQIVINRTPDERNFWDIKLALLRNIGLNPIPIIQVRDSNYGNDGSLYLRHVFEGRHLKLKETAKTLEYFYYFWPRPICLETKIDRRQAPFIYRFDGINHQAFEKK